MAVKFNTERNIYPQSQDFTTIKQLELALFLAFGPDTLREDQIDTWDPNDPANNQCVCAALVVNAFLPEFDSIYSDSEADHYWGVNSRTREEIDLTRCQKSLIGVNPEPKRIRLAGELLEGERAKTAKTRERFELLLRRTQANLEENSVV